MDERTAFLLQRLRDLPPVSVFTSLRSPRGTVDRSFRGPLLYDYAVATGMQPRGVSGAGMGNYYFVSTAEDGFRVAVSYAEVSAHFTPKQVILAYEQDGEPLEVGVRLVVPGDDLGGRSISGVVSIELKQIDAAPAPPGDDLGGRSIIGVVGIELKQIDAAPAPPGSGDAALDLSGLLDRPVRLRAVDLARFARTEVETLPTPRKDGTQAPPQAYAGVHLFRLLESRGIQLDPNVREDFLKKVIVARGRDGYAAVIAGGEIEPRFMNGPVIVATARGAGPLAGHEGGFRLVVPYDTSVGRCVKDLASLELCEA